MPPSRGSPKNTPKPEFIFRFFFTRLEARGEAACKRAFIVALILALALGVPLGVGLGIGLGWRVATADLSIVWTALGKAFSGISVRAMSRE
jgi:hypothetical protein